MKPPPVSFDGGCAELANATPPKNVQVRTEGPGLSNPIAWTPTEFQVVLILLYYFIIILLLETDTWQRSAVGVGLGLGSGRCRLVHGHLYRRGYGMPSAMPTSIPVH